MNKTLNTKRYFIILSCLIFPLMTIIKIGHAQENKPKESSSQQDKARQEWEAKIKQLKEENHSLSHALEENKKEIKGLKEKITAKQLEKEFLESMLRAQTKYLKPPELVRQDENNLEKIIHLNLGFAYGMKDDIKNAIEQYQKALAYSPQDRDIHYNLGYLLTKESRYQEAIEEYKKALKGVPQDREIYYNLAIIYATGLKDQKTGQEYYRRFTALSPTNTIPSLQTEKAP